MPYMKRFDRAARPHPHWEVPYSEAVTVLLVLHLAVGTATTLPRVEGMRGGAQVSPALSLSGETLEDPCPELPACTYLGDDDVRMIQNMVEQRLQVLGMVAPNSGWRRLESDSILVTISMEVGLKGDRRRLFPIQAYTSCIRGLRTEVAVEVTDLYAVAVIPEFAKSIVRARRGLASRVGSNEVKNYRTLLLKIETDKHHVVFQKVVEPELGRLVGVDVGR